MRKPVKSPIQHVVIIVKENHAFDNYFGRFPGADGDPNLALASDPPSSDHPHTHAAWLKRANVAAKEQYAQANIPNYWRYAQHALRQILYRGYWSVDTEPLHADRGRLALHQQPPF